MMFSVGNCGDGPRPMKLPSPEKEHSDAEFGLPEPNSLFPQYSDSLPQFENDEAVDYCEGDGNEETITFSKVDPTAMSDGTPMTVASTPRFRIVGVTSPNSDKQIPLHVQTDDTTSEDGCLFQHPSDFPYMSPPRKMIHFHDLQPNPTKPDKEDAEKYKDPKAKYRLWLLLAIFVTLLVAIIILPVMFSRGGSSSGGSNSAGSSSNEAELTGTVPVKHPTVFSNNDATTATVPPELPPMTTTPKPVALKLTALPTQAPVVKLTVAPSIAVTTLSPSTVSPTTFTVPTTAAPTTPPPTLNRNHPLVGVLYEVTPLEVLLNPYSPQGQAISWMASKDKQEPRNDERIRQRYAMTVLDVALHAPAPRLWSSRNLHECQWAGVTCNDEKHVTEINWARQKLNGTIPMELGILTQLEKLDIAQNQLKGTLDPIYNLEKLEYAYLFENYLTGTLSRNIENCQNLTRLFIGHNQLEGSFPAGLKMRPLAWFVAHFNKLTGTIPADMSFGLNTVFDVSNNQLSGQIPENLAYEIIPNVRHLYLDNNRFTGTIPESFVDLGKGRLRQLYLNDNELSSTFPDNWLTVKFLNNIDISNNNFKNSLDEMCQMSVFEYGELVELRADCNICNCKRLCRTCRDNKDFKYEYDDDTWEFDDEYFDDDEV